MRTYGITATITFETNVKVEGSMVDYVKESLRDLVANEGIDKLLDALEFGEVFETDITDEEWEEMAPDLKDLRVPMDKFKEYLVAVSLGLVERPIVSPERAQEILVEWDSLINKNNQEDEDD